MHEPMQPLSFPPVVSHPAHTNRGFKLTKAGKLDTATVEILLDMMPEEFLPLCGRQGRDYAAAQVQA
jgi:hypothetical protein